MITVILLLFLSGRTMKFDTIESACVEWKKYKVRPVIEVITLFRPPKDYGAPLVMVNQFNSCVMEPAESAHWGLK